MSKKKPITDVSGRFAYEGLDRVIHEKARLSIVTSLATHPAGLIFNDLKDLCALTDGNLSRHLQILSEAGLIQIWKGFKDNRPQTLCMLTDDGRKSLHRVHHGAGKYRDRRRRHGEDAGRGAEVHQGLVAGMSAAWRVFLRFHFAWQISWARKES